MSTDNVGTKPDAASTDEPGVAQEPFGFYDHFNDVLYRGPLAWVEADKARTGW